MESANFTLADRCVEFSETNGMVIIGHTLVWHSHYKLIANTPSMQEMDETISAFATLGVKVMIRELDVDVLPSAHEFSAAV